MIGAVLVAAGDGRRLGTPTPKGFVTLAGRPLFLHPAATLRPVVDALVVAVGADRLEAAQAALELAGIEAAAVPGGATRAASVAAGMAALPQGVEVVAVHDGARPLVTAGLLRRCLDALDGVDAAAPALAPVDTLKRVLADEIVSATLDRDRIRAVQTPQVFRLETLRQAHARPDAAAATDDLSLVERAGGRVRLIAGDRRNFKVTHPEDLLLAEALLARGGERPAVRVGQGVDVHAFDPSLDRPLRLGGVVIPDAAPLAGHSDADPVLHAITDAVLGACGAGDLGSLFGTEDPRWAGADSAAFLGEAVRRAAGTGWRVSGVDASVVAAQPRLAPHREAMRDRIAALLGLHAGEVSVKATTTDGLGALGRGEGVACLAIVTLERQPPLP